MADESQLSLLKQGVKAWNEWRRETHEDQANLSGAKLNRADLIGANLIGANLSGANLSMANLFGADLSEANLSGAILYGALLSGANLNFANLSGANLFLANLWSARLDRANFGNAMVGSTIFGGVDLSSCSGLDSVQHLAPSTLGVDSIVGWVPARLSEKRKDYLRADGKDILSVTMVLNSEHSRADSGVNY